MTALKARCRRAAAYCAAAAAPLALSVLVFGIPNWPKPYSWQYLGTALAVAIVGGIGPGLAALAVATLCVLWLRVPTPVHPGVEMFVAIDLCLLALLHRWRRSQEREREALEAAKIFAERSRAAAEEANSAKDHFLAVASHELRSPLAPLLTGIELLKKDLTLSARAHGYLEVLRRNVELEARLIDDLLDVTRIARGKVEFETQKVAIAEIIEQAVDVCRPEIDARGLRFDLDLGNHVPCFVEGDAGRLQQVFWNILKNAIKFTPKGGAVAVRCRCDGREVITEVSDTGVGIEPEQVSRIFDAFAQAEPWRTRRFGGLGLGLSISKALVEMHGGTIAVQSEGTDRGATFTVRLPVLAAS